MLQTVSVIVPCYNEEDALPLFFDELMRVLATMDCDYEIILVDDGSVDNTLRVMKELAGGNSRVHYISFSRNFGKEAAMYAGLSNATGDYVAVMDADLQHPPSLLPQMLIAISRDGYDSVATRRETRQGESVVKSLLSKTFYSIMQSASDIDLADSITDFRLMRRDMVDAIICMSERDRFSKGIFEWVGFNTRIISYPNVERVAGRTKWNLRNLMPYAMSGIVNFSYKPLSGMLWTGVIITSVAVVALLILLIRWASFGANTAGWVTATSIMAFLSGLQLMSLGILGQYIANVHKETKRRPHYIIAESDITVTGKSDRDGHIERS